MPSFERMPTAPLSERPLVPLPAEHTKPANDTEQKAALPTETPESTPESAESSKEALRARYDELMAKREKIQESKRKLDQAEQYVLALIRGFLQTPQTAYAQWYDKAFSTLQQLPSPDLFPQDRAYAEQVHANAEGHIKDLGLREILSQIGQQRATLNKEVAPIMQEVASLIDEINAMPDARKESEEMPEPAPAPSVEPASVEEVSGVQARSDVPPGEQQSAA